MGTWQGDKLAWKAEATLAKRNVPPARDNKMVKALAVKEFSCLNNLPRDQNILR